jgi:hypothetical protein
MGPKPLEQFAPARPPCCSSSKSAWLASMRCAISAASRSTILKVVHRTKARPGWP